jgi:Tol biopolymer transport system component
MNRLLPFLLIAAVALTACQDDGSMAPAADPMAAVSDGAHGDGNPDFFFLPPLVGDPSSEPTFEPGMFNGRLYPVMTVHEISEETDPPQPACSGIEKRGPQVVPAVPDDEMYQIDWDTDDANLATGTVYRLCVWGSSSMQTMLGFLDLMPVEGGMKNVKTDTVFAFNDGRVIPVKFRIEQGALSYDPLATEQLGTEFTVTDTGGSVVLIDEYTQTEPLALLAVAIPDGAIGEGDTVTIIVSQEEPVYGDPNELQCLPGDLLQSNWCYQIRTEPELYEFQDTVHVEICVDAEPVPERLRDALRVFKNNEAEGLVELPWAEPTLIGSDCTGLPEFGAATGVFDWLGRWAGRLLAPKELHASVFGTVPKGIGGTGGSFSDFGGAVPPLTEPVAFTSDRDGDWDIYAMEIDGSGIRQLTDDPSADTGPAISPDGQTIAFVSDRSGNLDIWTMRIDGTDLEQLTTSTYPDSAPAWSPDGTRIAFHRNIDGSSHHVWVINADGSGETDLFVGHKPVWSPDGTRIAFAKFGGSQPDYSDVFVANLDGSGLANLTNNDANDTDPTWSPDGSRIAFMSTRDGNDLDIFVMDADDPFWPVNLTHESGVDYRPDWAANDSAIAFVRIRSGNADIWAMSPDGMNVRNLTNHPAHDNEVALRTPSVITLPTSLIRDQSNYATVGTSYGCGTGGGSLFQSFTPAVSSLAAVDLALRAGGSFPSAGYTTEIRVLEGDLNGEVVATGSAFVSGPVATGATFMVRFPISPALTLTAGSYVIVWTSPAEGDGVLTWMGIDGDVYPGGAAYSCSGTELSGDMVFATWR